MLRALLAIALLGVVLMGHAATPCASIVGWAGFPLCAEQDPPEVPTLVPDVIGDDEATATAAIEAEGLFVADPTFSQCSAEALGTVVDQNPDAGTAMSEGEFVSLWLSSGVACGDGVPPLWLRFDRRRF
jgi:beta-lactam-binding protein with PASTA domain